MTTLEFTRIARDFSQDMVLFAQNNYYCKELLWSPRTNNLNFIYDSTYRYYLSTQHLQEIHDKILNFSIEKSSKKIDPRNVFTGTMENINADLRRAFNRILKINRNPLNNNNSGRPSNLTPYLPLLKNMLNLNLDCSVEVLSHTLRRKISEFFSSDDKEEYLKFRCSETSMCSAFGGNLIKAYLVQITPFYHKNTMNLVTSDALDRILRVIFDIYHNQILAGNKILVIPIDSLAVIKTILAELHPSDGYTVLLNHDDTLQLLCDKLLSDALSMLLRKTITIGFIDLEAYLEKYCISDTMLRAMLTFIQESSVRAEFLLGSIVVNHLIEEKIFSLVEENLQDKTIYYLELSSKLTFTIQRNGSDVKPFLCKENKNNFSNNHLTLDNDIVLNFKRAHLLNPLRNNKTGYCYFTPESIFTQHPDIAEIYGSIDKDFLNLFLDDLEKYADKRYRDFADTTELDDLYSFLYCYRINFKDIYANTPEIHKAKVEALIDLALDFSNNASNELRDSFQKDITDINLRKPLLVYLNQISSYQVVLKAALMDHIIYSCFGYFIMPSFFDFRGRRYYHGITFNIQSYPFLKAFVKLYDIPEEEVNEENFNKISLAVADVIKDPDIKQEVKKHFNNFGQYKKRLSQSVRNFFYDQINPAKLSKEEFDIFFLNPPKLYKDLYHTTLGFLKKKHKILEFLSFFILEQKKLQHNLWYTNSYSYDMTTSGYQMLALTFKSKSLGKYSNVTVDEDHSESLHDLYTMVAENFQKSMLSAEAALKNFLDNLSDQSLQKTLIEFFQDFNKTTLRVNLETLIKKLLLNEVLLNTLVNAYDKMATVSWILFTRDRQIMKAFQDQLYNITYQKALIALLILVRIYNYTIIIENNPEIKVLLSSRNSVKGIVMIDIYGGKRQGRSRSFYKFIKEMILEKGHGFKENSMPYSQIFNYVNNHFVHFKVSYLKESDMISKAGKVVSLFTDVITIQSKYFTCCLCPAHRTNPRRIRIDTKTIQVSRKSYQQNLYRNKLDVHALKKRYRVVTNKKKMTSLFPPDFTHFVDAYGVQLFLEMLYKMNAQFFNISPLFKVTGSTIHDNFSIGRFLLPILPYLLVDIYRHIFDSDPLSFLKMNFPSEEYYNKFRQKFSLPPKSCFSRNFIANKNFIKYG